MNRIKRNYLIVTIITTTFFMISCGSDEQNNKSKEKDTENNKIQSVEVVNPQLRTFNSEVMIAGTAEPNQKIIIYAMESGYVKNIFKDIGDNVRKDELIAQLANPELIRNHEEIKVQVNAKKIIYDRLKSSYEKTPALTPLQIVDDAEAEYLKLNASLNALQERINFLQIKAPFKGKITKKIVDNGALVQSGLTEKTPQGIVEIQEIDPIRLTIPLPESDIAAIDIGMEVSVIFPELPGDPFNAKISRIAGALDPASKTMQIEIDIKNPTEFIKPGMYANVLIQLSSRKDVISLPVTSQWIYQNQAFVMIVGNNKVVRIPLRKGLSNKDYFEVLNPEITENSLVIIQGKGLVKPGQSVKTVLKIE